MDGQLIKSAIYFEKNWHFVDIFARTSKGIPGIELIGIGNLSKSVKEKMIFLTKSYHIPVPLKRYVITMELPDYIPNQAKSIDFKGLELALFVLFLNLCGHLQIFSLKQCFCLGTITPTGSVRVWIPSTFPWQQLDQQGLTNISSVEGTELIFCNERFLDIQEVLSPINGLVFEEFHN